MRITLIKLVKSLSILFVIFITLPPSQLSANDDPWQINKGEKNFIGTVMEINSAEIIIKEGLKEYSYAPSDNVITALMGTCSGYLLPLTDFPLNIEVELFINEQNKVRAMRNKQIYISANEGTALNGWGHYASISPNELYYTLYNWETGLHLYKNVRNSSPVFLSPLSVSSWNCKSEIAVSRPDDILILDPQRGKRSILALPKLNDGCGRVITSINWDNNGEKLFYTSLEDYPDTESAIFNLTILDRAGRTLGSTIIANLDSAVWLTDNIVLFAIYDDLEIRSGKILLWDYETGEISEFLSSENGYYSNLTYNSELKYLAYTETCGVDVIICLFNTNNNASKELYKSPFPIKNLQWSYDGKLFFWDEYNNCIFKILTENKGIAISLRTGYLPAEGVRSSYIYFLAEPIEEPQQVFLIKNKPD